MVLGPTLTPMDQAQRELASLLISGLNLEGLSPDDIDPLKPLFAGGLGLDSIDALEIAVLVERHYGVKAQELETHREAFASLAALSEHIAARRAPAL